VNDKRSREFFAIAEALFIRVFYFLFVYPLKGYFD